MFLLSQKERMPYLQSILQLQRRFENNSERDIPMTAKPQIWVIELEIPKTFIRWRSHKIREIIETFVEDLEGLDISNYHIYGNVKPRIKVKQYLKRG